MGIERQAKNPLMEYILNRLKELGWKPVDLARNANVYQSVVSRLLNDSKQVSVDNIYKILKVLGAFRGESINSSVNTAIVGEISKGYNTAIEADLQKELQFLKEQVRFYKEKADFFELKCTDLERRLLSSKRVGDPDDLDVKNLRRLFNGSSFPYGFESE